MYLLGLLGRVALFIRAHSAETLIEHPQREEEPGRVHAHQKILLVVGNRNGEMGWLAHRQSFNTRQNRGDNMGRIDADPEGGATLVVVQCPRGIDKDGQLNKAFHAQEHLEPHHIVVSHDGVFKGCHIPVYGVRVNA